MAGMLADMAGMLAAHASPVVDCGGEVRPHAGQAGETAYTLLKFDHRIR
jgi:hypothetical protein